MLGGSGGPKSGGSGAGVNSLNNLMGNVTLSSGTNITITPSGNNLTIASTGGGGTPGGSTGQIQYNSSGAFAGASQLVYDGVHNYTGIAIDSSLPYTLSYPFQVGGGTTYLPPTSVTGTINYYTTPVPPTSPVFTPTYVQELPDSASMTAMQSGTPGGYVADGTVNLTYYVAGYQTINGVKYYSPGATSVGFMDNGDTSNFSVVLTWVAIPGVTSYEIWVNGSYNGNTFSYASQDVGNVLIFSDNSYGWTSAVAYPPTPNVPQYAALGHTESYDIYSYSTPVGSINLYSTTFLNASFTDDGRSQQPPTSGYATISTSGGTYVSNGYTHSYEVWTQYADGGYSSTSRNLSVNDGGPQTVADPTGLSATQNTGGSGYTANGYSFTYTLVSYRVVAGGQGYVFSPGSSYVLFTDDNSGNPYSVQIGFTPAPNATGTLIFISGGPSGYYYYSQTGGITSGYNDSNSGWNVFYPFPMNTLQDPSFSMSATQNDAETGYGPSDGSYSFTYYIAAQYYTPLGYLYSPGNVSVPFTDSNDSSPSFGIDLGWNFPTAGSYVPSTALVWVIGTSSGPQHPTIVSQVVPGTTFSDQNTGWGGSYVHPQLPVNAYYFTYEVNVGWSSVTGAVNYLILKTGGDSGPSYPIYITQLSITIVDTDDSLWTAYSGANPPTPTEVNTYYDLSVSYTAAAGSPEYRVVRTSTGGGGYDTSATNFHDGAYLIPWSGSTSVVNTLYHATGATQSVQTYSYNNTTAVYSLTHTDQTVTDDNSGRYYSVLWAASNYQSGADKLKFIVNATYGEFLSNPTLSFTDNNQNYNSDITVTPSRTAALFYADDLGDVTINELTCLTWVVTPQIGNGVGIFQLGSGADAAGIQAIAVGGSSYAASDSIALGPTSSAAAQWSLALLSGATVQTGATYSVAIGYTAIVESNSTSSVAIGNNASVGSNAGSSVSIGDGSRIATSCTACVAIGPGAEALEPGAMALGLGALATNLNAIALLGNAGGSNSICIGYISSAAGQHATGIGYQCMATGTESICIGSGSSATSFDLAIGYVATASGGDSIAIGVGATSSGSNSLALGTQANASAPAATAIGNTVSNATANSAHFGASNTHKLIVDTTNYYMLNPHGAAQEKILGDLDTVVYNDEVVTFKDGVVYY